MSDTFQCDQCHERKTLDCFYRTAKAARGHDSTCKKCRRQRARAREQAMREGIIPPTPSFARVRYRTAKASSAKAATRIDIDGLALDIAEIISSVLKERLTNV